MTVKKMKNLTVGMGQEKMNKKSEKKAKAMEVDDDEKEVKIAGILERSPFNLSRLLLTWQAQECAYTECSLCLVQTCQLETRLWIVIYSLFLYVDWLIYDGSVKLMSYFRCKHTSFLFVLTFSNTLLPVLCRSAQERVMVTGYL